MQQGAAHDRAAADAWSLGVCLHMLLMGAPPAAAETLHRAGSSESSSGSGRRVSPEPQLQFSQHVRALSICLQSQHPQAIQVVPASQSYPQCMSLCISQFADNWAGM